MKSKSDSAMSDVVGTMIMLGATVAVVGLVSVNLLSSVDESIKPAPVDVMASARPGENWLTLVHAGGPAVDAGDIRVVVSAAGATLRDGTLGGSGTTWQLGESEIVPLSGLLTPGQDVVISLVSVTHGTTIASAAIHLPNVAGATLPGGAYSLNVMFDTSSPTTTVYAPAPILVRASVVHPQGRLAIDSVLADLTPIDAGALPLLDGGAAGDALAGDGIFSGYSVVPASVPAGDYTITVEATDFDGASTSSTGTVTVTPVASGPTGATGATGADGSSGSNYYNGTNYITGNTTGTFSGNTTIYGNVTNLNVTYVNGTGGANGSNGSDGSITGNFSGNTTGNFTGNSTGNFTGNFSGNLPEVMVYNKSLIASFAHRIIKYEGGPSDAVTTEVKLKLVNDPIVMEDGRTYTLKSVNVNYDWLKPGNTPWIPLDDGGSGGAPWFCRDDPLHVYSLKAGNETIIDFDRRWDPLYYYFILQWQQVGGTRIHEETVSTTATDQYFTLRRTAQFKEVKELDGWTQDYADCSNQ